MTISGADAVGLPLVVVVAPVPPPLHGAAATTEGILAFLKPHAELHVANVSPGHAGRWGKHAVRIARTLGALALLVRRASRKGRVLYMTADGGPGMIYNVMVAAVGTMLGYRVYLHHHSFAYIDRTTLLMTTLSRILARRGTHVVLCPAMADGLRARYPVGATLELSSAALLPPAPREPRTARATLRMGFLSNLIIEKGLDTSIDLLRSALSEGLDVELVVAGRAPDQKPLDLIAAAQAEMGKAMTYLGPLSEADKDRFLDDLDVFLFPSRYFNEAQPRAVLEALAHGVPVLTIARSCITTDMGEGTGLCAARGGDFIAEALPLLRHWTNDRDALDATSRAADARGDALHRLGQAQLHQLAQAFSTPAP